MSERTVARRQADPGFRRRVAELRSNMVSAATGRLAEAATLAADQLRELMTGAEAEGVRLHAAKALLDAALRFQAANELEQRLADLERRMTEDGTGRL